MGIGLFLDVSGGYGHLLYPFFCAGAQKKTSSGLAAGYAASFFAVFIYFSAYVTMIPQIYEPDVQVLRDSMDHTPGAFLLGTALVWTAASFVWRQLRKRVVYEWKDHI